MRRDDESWFFPIVMFILVIGIVFFTGYIFGESVAETRFKDEFTKEYASCSEGQVKECRKAVEFYNPDVKSEEVFRSILKNAYKQKTKKDLKY